MGYSRWDTEDTRSAYAATTTLRAVQSREEIFTQRTMREDFNPVNITLRESRDSEQNPASTPIIIGLDVTGSMGHIAEKLAKGELGKLMNGIFDTNPVTDPHVMVMAIGDATCDRAPLQVSQFEADIRIDSSLQGLYLEGAGGGNSFESYDLPWHFAATRTATDSFEKRGKKGYLFTIGDELPPTATPYDRHNMERVFGPDQQSSTYNSRVALELARERYNVFHVIIEQGSFCRGSGKQEAIRSWTALLDRRALPLDDWTHLTDLILAAIHVNEGADAATLIKEYQDEAVRRSLHHAFGV
jgi:hypothetical protein